MHPPRQTDRAFGLTMSAALTVLFLVIWYLAERQVWTLAVVAGAFAVTALVAPLVLLPFNRLWYRFAGFLGGISNWLILGPFYFLVLTPVGVLARTFGRDPMERARAPDSESYLIDVSARTNACHFGDMF